MKFEIGKYYQHTGGGGVIHVLCEVHTFFHGSTLLVESEGGNLYPYGKDEVSAQGWHQVSGWSKSTYSGNNIPDPSADTMSRFDNSRLQHCD